jgi:hypothetical protein
VTEPDSEPVHPQPEPPPDPVDESRFYPRTIGGVLYLLVLAATVAGVGISWSGDWRFGVKWIGAALGAAGSLRLLLRQQDAGMLAVRHRLVDFGLLAGVGAALIFLSESIPNQPV